MDKIIITSQDINGAGTILGIEEGFDKQRQDVIKCLESKDIVACPGSGKTTALLAKLIILAQKMPFPDNKGICVLTHTNVAINEIKNKLGTKASLLLSYPNFVGTIQSFVDRYLAIPASIKYFGVRPSIIDTNFFNSYFIKTFKSIYGSWFHGFQYFCERNKLSVEDLRLSIYNDLIYRKDKVFEFKKESDKKYEGKIKDVFKRLYGSGILRYETALQLGERYISEFEEDLTDVFSERFIAVYIDEMQDTNATQVGILNKVFNIKTNVIQRYGDPNQAIYDFLNTPEGEWLPDNPLTITNSKRFHNNIAQASDFICQNRYNMTGTGESTIPPVVITYTNDDVSNVLEQFARLISHFNLTAYEQPIFKAVGMVRGRDDKLGIKSYYPIFDKKTINKSENKDFPALEYYINRIDIKDALNHNVGIYYNRFINAILKILRLEDVKANHGGYYSKRLLLKYLSEHDPKLLESMNRLFAKFVLLVESEFNIIKYFKWFVRIFLKRAFNVQPNQDVIEFMENQSEVDESSTLLSRTNVYEYNGIKIEIDTVHGVKGQTHTATLYLETFWNKKTIENIIEYIRGESKKRPGKQVKKQLKIAYVAMTRPKELLCITMESTVFKQNRDKLQALGWVDYRDILKDG